MNEQNEQAVKEQVLKASDIIDEILKLKGIETPHPSTFTDRCQTAGEVALGMLFYRTAGGLEMIGAIQLGLTSILNHIKNWEAMPETQGKRLNSMFLGDDEIMRLCVARIEAMHQSISEQSEGLLLDLLEFYESKEQK